jgi:hypothetical protein
MVNFPVQNQGGFHNSLRHNEDSTSRKNEI